MATRHKKVPLIQPLLFLVALASLATAFIAEYYFNLVPCSLCIYERYVYALIILCAVLSFVINLKKLWLVIQGLILIGGIGLSGYHFGVEQHWFSMPSSCRLQKQPIPKTLKELKQQMKKKRAHTQCNEITWKIFGVSATFWNILLQSLMLALLVAALAREQHR